MTGEPAARPPGTGQGARLGGEALERLIESAPTGMLVLDAADAVVGWNRCAGDLIADAAEDPHRRSVFELFAPAAEPQLRALLAGTGTRAGTHATAGAPVLVRHRPAGTRHYVEVSCGPRLSGYGEATRLLVLHEVTGRVLADRARRRTEQANAFLAETGALLEASLDPVQTLQRIASLAVPSRAELCVIDLLNADGALEGVALAAVDPEIERALADVRRHEPLDRHSRHPVARVLRYGKPLLVDGMNDSTYTEIAHGPAHLALMRKLHYRSAIVAPLTARGRTFGVISLLYLSPELRYSEDDLLSLVDVARRAALALDNARLYEREHRTAETLQRSLLPARLPRIPGLSLAARYEPGEGAVGGDWYDVIALPRGRVGCVVGDIVGRGIGAATVMGQLRNAVRVYALERASAAEVLDAVDHLAASLGIGQMTTVLYLIVDPVRETVELSSAGHPPPLMLMGDGTARYLHSGRSAPLAIGEAGRHVSAVEPFPRSSGLIMYTDGLIERRDRPLDEGLAMLAEVATAAPREPAQLVGEVVERLRHGANVDDVAVLVIGNDG